MSSGGVGQTFQAQITHGVRGDIGKENKDEDAYRYRRERLPCIIVGRIVYLCLLCFD